MSNKLSYADLILHWYDHHQRVLPWRAIHGETPNPYHVLLSEIMLQQTQVATVIPYFNRFIDIFPTIRDLANASLDQVMTLWTGLGYYSRARNLHRCAEQIMTQGGDIPNDFDALKLLSGIGDYTASAIMSIGFNQPYVPVDGNVERITARLFAVSETLPAIKPKLSLLAKTLNQGVSAQQRPGDFAQGLFDIGATICKPKNPLCLLCPLMTVCKAYQQNIANDLPKRVPKTVKPIRYGVSFFIQNDQHQILLQKRPSKGLLANTLELPGTLWNEQEWNLDTALASMGYDHTNHENWVFLGDIKHIFTHFTLNIKLYCLTYITTFNVGNDQKIWYHPDELDQYPCSSLMQKMVAHGLK